MYRRGAALIAALALTFPALVAAPTLATAAPPDTTLLAHYDFEGLEPTPGAGAVVADVSGNGHDAVVRGAGASAADGALALPGGSPTSGAAYVALPTGMVDGQNTLTISTWMKNETAAGNYAALFFGTTQSTPAQYWLFNPKNPAGVLKSVLTGSLNTSAPWNSEVGISPTIPANGIAGPATTAEWSMYTTVIEEDAITAYLDGHLVGSVAVTRTVTQLGSDLVGYIGRSSYPDTFWKGQVRDLTVHTSALSAGEVARAYLDGVEDAGAVLAALTADADALTLGGSLVSADLTLPATGSRGSTITWTSSDEAHLASDGTVTRPTGSDVDVVLTATLEAGGQRVTRTFPVTVVADTPDRNLALVADTFDLGITHVAEDLVLRTSVGGAEVTWQSSAPEHITADGRVARDVEREVTLTATFTLDGRSTTRDYVVTLLAAEAGRVGSYIAEGDTTRTDVLHLAVSTDSATYTPVNNGRGVLYPTLAGAKLGSPELFRTPDGAFGLVATVDDASSRIYLYDSADLVTYTNERVVTFSSMTATRVSVAWDNGAGAYVLTFTAREDGATYQVTSTDLRTFTAPVPATGPRAPETGTFPSGAIETSSIAVTATELARVQGKLGRVVATGVAPLADVVAGDGGTIDLPEAASITYSSGWDTPMPIVWDEADLAAVDRSTPGTYLVGGTVTPTDYADVLVERRADPDVTLGDDGWYYFTASYPMTSAGDPEGYDRVVLRRAETIEGLAAAPEVTIWDEASDPVLNRYVWAPELTKIGEDWYVLFTAARTGGVWDIRPVVLKFTGAEFGGEATLDPANWTSLGQVRAAPGDTDAFTHFSLDMTHLETGGRHYLVWAEKPGPSNLRIAEIDPSDPTQLLSRSALLSTPTYAWESWGSESINEGPAVIEHDGTLIVTYSAGTVDDKYCVGMLTMPLGADPMDPASWTKNPYPLLTTDDVPGEVGPGHNSFTVDALGNPVIVYHSRTVDDTSAPGEATDAGLFDPRRHARAATVHWDVDGLPVLAMTAAEELPQEMASIQVRVIVGAPAEAVSATLSPASPDGEAGWYRTAPVLTLALAPGSSGTGIEYRVDGDRWVTYTGPVTVATDGRHVVEHRAVVASRGEPEVTSTELLVDLTDPESTAHVSPLDGVSQPGGSVVVTLAGTDATSGLARIEHRIDGGAWVQQAGPVTVATTGTAVLEHRAVDVAGNTSPITPVTLQVVAADDEVPTATEPGAEPGGGAEPGAGPGTTTGPGSAAGHPTAGGLALTGSVVAPLALLAAAGLTLGSALVLRARRRAAR